MPEAFAQARTRLDKPEVVTVLQPAALAPKLLLSVWVIFGGAGLPPLGLLARTLTRAR